MQRKSSSKLYFISHFRDDTSTYQNSIDTKYANFQPKILIEHELCLKLHIIRYRFFKNHQIF